MGDHMNSVPSRNDFWAVTAAAVSGKSSDDLAPGTLNSILKQAGLKK